MIMRQSFAKIALFCGATSIILAVIFERFEGALINYGCFKFLYEAAIVCGIFVSGNAHQPEPWTMRIVIAMIAFISLFTIIYTASFMVSLRNHQQE